VCPSCDFIKPPGVHVCPACGFKPELVQDVEVADGQLEKIARKARKEYTIEEKQAFLGGLNRHAAKKGMKIHRKGFYGWALYRFQDKFGCRPSSKMSWSHQCGISEEVKKFIQHGNIKFAKGKEKKAGKIENNRNGEIIKMEGCPKCGSKNGVYVQGAPWKIECVGCGEFIRNVTKESLEV
jgi:ribosomal protein S27E